MYPKFKTNLTGLAVALGFVLVGYGLGEPPRNEAALAALPVAMVEVTVSPVAATGADSAVSLPSVSRVALKRHLAMPYVSFAALSPRSES